MKNEIKNTAHSKYRLNIALKYKRKMIKNEE